MIVQPKLPVKVPMVLWQQKSTGKQSVPFCWRSCLLRSIRTVYGIAPALCSFAVAARTRCVEAKIIEAKIDNQEKAAARTQYVEAKGLAHTIKTITAVATYTRRAEAKVHRAE